jgi:hypothetical protein
MIRRKLLSYTNTDSWDVTDPGMSEKMKQLVEDKDPQRPRNVIDGWTQDWHGCVSYPALAQFMATGLMSRHQPGGFTLFMFKPMSLRRRTKDETEVMLRSTMGEYKVNDKILRDFAKTDWHLRMDIDSALRQIQTGWRFLELLFCKDTIAAEGYQYGETVRRSAGDQQTVLGEVTAPP